MNRLTEARKIIEALKHECLEHDADYHHVTNKGVLERAAKWLMEENSDPEVPQA